MIDWLIDLVNHWLIDCFGGYNDTLNDCVHLFTLFCLLLQMFEKSFNCFDFQDGVRPVDLSLFCLADVDEDATDKSCDEDDDEIDDGTAERIACDCTEDIENEGAEESDDDALRLDGNSCCHGDENKENSAVNDRVKRLIAQQNSPSFIRPKGYISPLTCVAAAPQK